MKVTVIEQIEHGADVTPGMVEAYVVRNGWMLDWDGPSTRGYEMNGEWRIVVGMAHRHTDENELAYSVRTIARALGRKPHEVLADIARGM